MSIFAQTTRHLHYSLRAILGPRWPFFHCRFHSALTIERFLGTDASLIAFSTRNLTFVRRWDFRFLFLFLASPVNSPFVLSLSANKIYRFFSVSISSDAPQTRTLYLVCTTNIPDV
ncbi:hypothetical protein RSAG8_13319, partial [Rhizoctonia solani AG-8 WAC10335]